MSSSGWVATGKGGVSLILFSFKEFDEKGGGGEGMGMYRQIALLISWGV